MLSDIHIQGDEDGIQTAARLLAGRAVPLIYLSSFADRATLARALATGPAAYLPKPVSVAGLRTAIELALHQFALARQPAPAAAPAAVPSEPEKLNRETILQLDEHVFIKHQQQFVRVPLAAVLLLQADSSHTTLSTAGRRYALRLPLSAVLERLQAPQLVRVHRSSTVNIQQVASFSDHELTVGGQVVPLGRHYLRGVFAAIPGAVSGRARAARNRRTRPPAPTPTSAALSTAAPPPGPAGACRARTAPARAPRRRPPAPERPAAGSTARG